MIKIRRNFAIPLRLPSQESTDDLKRALDAFLNNIPKVYDVPSEADAVLAPLRKKIELLVYNRSMFSSGKPFDSDILIDGANDYLINFLALVESSEIAFNSCGGKSGFFNPKDSTIAVNWGWEESLRKGKVIRAFDCDFEKFSVAWLLAACYSRKASELQEFKEKTILYQKSAGIYEWIDDNCAGNALWGSSDLSKSSLLWCREILIAEGAICTFFNGFFKGLSPNSLKKLAQGASDLLQGVINGQGLDSLVRQGLITSGILSYMKHSWYCMRAEAQWFASQADNLDGKYGDEISRLNLAFEICDQSRKQNYKNHEIDTWRSDLLERICNRIADAVKDNDRIYFLPVPKHHDLPVIESKVLGQVGLFELTIPSSEDFFNFKDLKSLTATGDFCGLDVQRLFGGDIPALNFEVKSFGDDFELQTRIYELKKMGFSYDDAKSALEKNGNDIDLAIDHLSKNLSTSNGINERDISPPSYLHSLIHEKGGNEDISCEQKSDENQPPEFVEDETDGSSTIITKPPLSMKLKRIFSFGLLNSSKNGVANNDRVRKIFNIEDNVIE